MNFDDIIKQISERWTISERYELINELESAPRGASTGGEAIDLYAGFLLDLKQGNPDSFTEIEDLVDEFAKECAAYGSILKGYNYKPYWRS